MRKMIGRRLVAAVGTVSMAITLAGVSDSSLTASAARGDPGYVVQGAPVRPCPSFGCRPAWHSVGSWVYLDCWHDVQDGGWRRWIKYLNNNLWVLADHVGYPQPQLPRC